MKKLYLIFILCLAFILTACPGGGGVTGENARIFSGTAFNTDGKAYTGGAGKLFIKIGSAQNEVGTIEANGKFTVSLPKAIADKDLIAPSPNGSGPVSDANHNCQNTIKEGKNTKTYPLLITVKSNDGKFAGYLMQTSAPTFSLQVQNSTQKEVTMVQRLYTPNRIVAEGSCQPTTNIASTIDVVMGKGWNVLVTKITQNTNADQSKINISMTTPATLPDVKFYVIGSQR